LTPAALVKGKISVDEVSVPTIQDLAGAIVRVTTSAICGPFDGPRWAAPAVGQSRPDWRHRRLPAAARGVSHRRGDEREPHPGRRRAGFAGPARR
jgi:hypothetical protein